MPLPPVSGTIRPLLLWVVWLACILPTIVPARTAPGGPSADAILDTLRTGRWRTALELIRDYNAQHPGDARMLYNQACLENRAGEREASLGTLRRALDAGFVDMGFALRDPDLEGVADDPVLFDLAPGARDSLLRRSRQMGLDLPFDTWSRSLELTSADPALPACSARLRWLDRGLRVEITTPPPWNEFARSGLPPWAGGPGAIVHLVVPDSSDAWSGVNGFTFACGFEKGGPTAAMYLDGPGRWQRVTELDPKLDHDPHGHLMLVFTIPWKAVLPFHPLVDPVLGVNIQVRRDSAHGYTRAVLMPDPWAWAPGAVRHRYTPVRFRRDSLTGELFMGRVDRSVVQDRPVDLQLTALSPRAGSARLSLSFLDPAGHPVLPDGPLTETVDLRAGVNFLVRQADFSRLQTGSYLLKAGLRFPSGEEASWSASILRMAPSWREDLAGRIGRVPESEQPTLRRMLDAIADALDHHLPRRNPGPVATTLQDLQSMLNQATATGSILPDHGPVTMVYPGPGGASRLCTLYLAPDSTGTRSAAPVLVLNRAAGHEGYLVDRIARNHEQGAVPESRDGRTRPVYVIPHAAGRGASEAVQEREAVACLRWCLDYLHAGRASVVGVDAAGAAALRLAMAAPGRVSGVMVFSGEGLTPWPGADDADLRAWLQPAAPVPVTWVEFPKETDRRGQGPRIKALLADLGWNIAGSTDVPGGLSLSQAADRLVRWVVAPSR